MSINSKVRREAKKRSAAKSQGKQPAGSPIEPHAELRDQQGSLLAGVVRRDGEWVLGMGFDEFAAALQQKMQAATTKE